eukprot:9711414-Ditylum_brightwellii.AAC.2
MITGTYQANYFLGVCQPITSVGENPTSPLILHWARTINATSAPSNNITAMGQIRWRGQQQVWLLWVCNSNRHTSVMERTRPSTRKCNTNGVITSRELWQINRAIVLSTIH